MSTQKPPAVGIDLGTTYSAVAHLDSAGQPQTLTNAAGEKLTPSIIHFEENQVVVGRDAESALATDWENIAECPKRELGKRVFPKVLRGRQYPPEALEAWILNKLRLDAQQRIGPVEKVVITVPAYFDEVRRKSTMDAGYMAGLEVMDIVNEPTAAALSFGHQRGFLRLGHGAEQRQRIIVYDLGGGTFDVTVMEIQGNEFIALATDGDVRLGGRDWDQRLVDYVAEEFIRNYGIDPREDPKSHGRLWRDCEKAKRTLSVRPKVSISSELDGCIVMVDVSRELFCEMTQDLLDRTAFTTRSTLQAAGLDWSDIDRVLLVGGSTRMPSVAAMMKRLSGKEPDTSVSPDEAVAHGAALHAGVLLARHAGQTPTFSIRNVNSHSLGVVGTDTATRKTRNAILIPRNTPLPVTTRRVFRTQLANQRSILVRIVEGESQSPDDCMPIGKCTVRKLPDNLPVQTPIEVSFKYEENGRLTVTVGIAGANTLLRHELTRENTLSQEQLDGWRQYISEVPPKAGAMRSA